ncbi:MAG TPA: hypothetical protein VF828_03625, partial [Patescibacteria group bacterium]
MDKIRQRNILVIITGLDNWMPLMKMEGKILEKQGIDKVVIFNSLWKSGEDYQIKARRLEKEIERYMKNYRVHLCGVSAGGLLAYRYLIKNHNKIGALLSYGGCNFPFKDELKRKQWADKLSERSSSVRQAIEETALIEKNWNDDWGKKCLNYFGAVDDIVPKEVSIVPGAKN